MAVTLSMSIPTFSDEDPGTWDALRTRALLADRAGVDRVVCSDHVVFGDDLDAYADPSVGGQRGARQPTGPEGHWLEPFTVLAWLAGQTERVRLGTSIMIAALRRPAVLAKQLSTLDVLAGGRVDLGVGVGWQRAEYEAAGLDFSARGALLDHTLAVCQTLWTETRADFADDRLSFTGLHQMPKPRQVGGVPIWVSGRVNRPVARRLARFGSGWIPWGDDAADLAAAIPRMAQAVADAGGDMTGVGVVGRLPVAASNGAGPASSARTAVDRRALADGVGPLLAAGVTDFRLPHTLPVDDAHAHDWLLAVVDVFDDVTGRRRP